MRNCRVCDSEPMIVEAEDFLSDDKEWEVKCSNWQCAVGNTVTKSNKDDAMTAWNRAQRDADNNPAPVWPEGATPCSTCSEPAVINLEGVMYCLCCGATDHDKQPPPIDGDSE